MLVIITSLPFSLNPISPTLFDQLYVPGATRFITQNLIEAYKNSDKWRDGTFILRDASRTPSPTPVSATQHYCVTYWRGEKGKKFNHLFVCCDENRLNWHVLNTETEFKKYDSLLHILLDIPYFFTTQCRNALVIHTDPTPVNSLEDETR